MSLYEYESKLYTLAQLRRLFPDISFPAYPGPEDLEPLGVTIVPDPEPEPEPEPDPETLEAVRKEKLEEINAVCDAILADLNASYPNQEMATFYRQELEARDYLADPTRSTPLLSALAEARNMEMEELVRKVMSKSDAFAAVSGNIIGQRQVLEAKLDSCTTIDQIRDINAHVIRPPYQEPVNA